MEVGHCYVCRELFDVKDLDDELACASCRDKAEAEHERQLSFDYYSRLL